MNSMVDKVIKHPIAFTIVMGTIVKGTVQVLYGIASVVNAVKGNE